MGLPSPVAGVGALITVVPYLLEDIEGIEGGLGVKGLRGLGVEGGDSRVHIYQTAAPCRARPGVRPTFR
ncbi:hypothetical protein SSP531S_11570 [Streptomyces spongiicola]|uniref:Uncharacterized protein n=1 Tax=Streptomyces spongiicola TaxID=1690221 RepID=A0A388SV98_9ACTN|nr:hypothetical protein SSP531S_11570 [Streptomyces spongiicola]